MVSQFGIANSNVQFELAAWHVYGDPTMEILDEQPKFGGLDAVATPLFQGDRTYLALTQQP